MGRSSVTDTDMGYDRLAKTLNLLAEKRYVVVGIRGEAGARRERATSQATTTKSGRPSKKTKRVGIVDPDAFTLVEIASVNEFGSEDGRIPERSFLRSTFDMHKDRYYRILNAAVTRVIAGRSEINHELGQLGLRAAGDVQKTIGMLREPPNAAVTIAKKGSSKPLRDTGRLAASIDFEVRSDDE